MDLTVVMPVYNQERYVRVAIDSILGQTYPHFEFVIVDDGSTDGTLDRVRSVDDPRIRLVAAEHAGFRCALERGVREAKGRWVARMDSDDVSHPTRLEKELAFLGQHPECVLVGTVYGLVTPNDRFLAPRESFDWRYVEPRHITLGGRGFGDATVMFRRRTALEVGLYDPEFDNENPLWYKMLRVGRGAVLGRPLYYARWHLNSHSRRGYREYASVGRALRCRYDPENARGLPPSVPPAELRSLGLARRAVGYYLQAGDRRAALTAAVGALRMYPTNPSALRLLARTVVDAGKLRFWLPASEGHYEAVRSPW